LVAVHVVLVDPEQGWLKLAVSVIVADPDACDPLNDPDTEIAREPDPVYVKLPPVIASGVLKVVVLVPVEVQTLPVSEYASVMLVMPAADTCNTISFPCVVVPCQVPVRSAAAGPVELSPHATNVATRATAAPRTTVRAVISPLLEGSIEAGACLS
jgi:hypothetical protein